MYLAISIAAMVLMAGGSDAKGDGANSNSVVQDGIEYYTQTDKAGYAVAEQVEMLYRVTNLREETLQIQFCNQEQHAFEVRDGNGARVWFAPVVSQPAGSIVNLEPGSHTEYSETWNLTKYLGSNEPENGTLVLPGTYEITGSLFETCGGSLGEYVVPVSVPIEITSGPIPAISPTGLAALTLGILVAGAVLVRRRTGIARAA